MIRFFVHPYVTSTTRSFWCSHILRNQQYLCLFQQFRFSSHRQHQIQNISSTQTRQNNNNDNTRTNNNNNSYNKQEMYEKKVYKEIMFELRNLRNNNNNNNNTNNNNFHQRRENPFQNPHNRQKEKKLFDMRHAFSSKIIRLTPKQFQLMSLKDIAFLLRLTASLMPVNGASHIASEISSVLSQKVNDSDIYENTEIVIQLLQLVLKSSSAASHNNNTINMNNRGSNNNNNNILRQRETGSLIEEHQLVQLLNFTMSRLIDHFAESVARQKKSEERATDEKKRKDQSEKSDQGETGVHNNIKTKDLAYYDDSSFRQRVILQFVSKSNDPRLERLFNEEILRALLVQILGDAKSFSIDSNGALASSQDEDKKQSPQLLSIVAIVATSICKIRLFNQTVVDFFKWAAPICIADVGLLNGYQIGFILEAFSLMGYHHTGLFLTLGERAGELGELLKEDEVARILNALNRTKIDHRKLRASLESSMRMRNLHKRPRTMEAY